MPIKVKYEVQNADGSMLVDDEDVEGLEGAELDERLQELVDEYARNNCPAMVAGWQRIAKRGR